MLYLVSACLVILWGVRVAFLVVEHYVKNGWKKYGNVRVMMNANGLFFFKFASSEGMNGVLENGPWFIQFVHIILKKWTPTSSLLKEYLNSVSIWVKFHDTPIVAFSVDGFSAIATKLGNPIMLDSYTSSMCLLHGVIWIMLVHRSIYGLTWN